MLRSCTGLVIGRADFGYYAAEVIAAIRRRGARFTVPLSPGASGTDDAELAAAECRAGAWDQRMGVVLDEHDGEMTVLAPRGPAQVPLR